MDPKLFVSQINSNRAIEDLTHLLGVPRPMLNVFGSPKGLVSGRLYFDEDDKSQSADTRSFLINPLAEYRSLCLG
jgi:meiotic recombination protein SPO11